MEGNCNVLTFWDLFNKIHSGQHTDPGVSSANSTVRGQPTPANLGALIRRTMGLISHQATVELNVRGQASAFSYLFYLNMFYCWWMKFNIVRAVQIMKCFLITNMYMFIWNLRILKLWASCYYGGFSYSSMNRCLQ